MAPRHDDKGHDDKRKDKDNGDDKGFLSRWSQRKRAAEEEADTPEREEALEASGDDDEIDPKDLPDIDSLEAGSDYSVFLKKGVPAGLKRKALNKLWQTDPAFRHICMLDDYNLDYTDAAMVVPNLKTAFQVGRGMVLPEEEEAAAKAAEAAEAPAVEAEDSPDAAQAVQDSLPAAGEDPQTAAAQTPSQTLPGAPQKRPPPRMPGTPLVPAAATRGASGAGAGRATAPQKGGRSARQRRWGDPGEV